MGLFQIERHSKVEHKYVVRLLKSLPEIKCQGKKCLSKRKNIGFFKPGKTPWIGHPTTIEVKCKILIKIHHIKG